MGGEGGSEDGRGGVRSSASCGQCSHNQPGGRVRVPVMNLSMSELTPPATYNPLHSSSQNATSQTPSLFYSEPAVWDLLFTAKGTNESVWQHTQHRGSGRGLGRQGASDVIIGQERDSSLVHMLLLHGTTWATLKYNFPAKT